MKEHPKPVEMVSLNFLGLKIELKNPGVTSVIILLLVLCFLISLAWLLKCEPGIFQFLKKLVNSNG
jgi:hypothetical protein